MADDDECLCAGCYARLPLISSPCCPKCSRPIRTRDGTDQLCGMCRLHPRPAVSRVFAAAEYRDSAKLLIHRYKYSRHQFLAGFLANHIMDRFPAAIHLASYDWLVPIPLHWTRQRWRGFNQSRELARCISRRSGIPVLPAGDFKRVRKTTPQVQLSAASRASNIKGAFHVKHDNYIRGMRLALVDDVLTTGSTAKECARTLRRAGAVDVGLIVMAR